MSKYSIYFIEQYFYPEGWNGVEITQKIVDIFVKRGDRVNVLCGKHPYVDFCENQSQEFTNLNAIKIIRLSDLSRSRKKIFRFFNSLLMSSHAFLILIFSRKVDLIIVQTNPPTIIIAASLAAFLLRKPLLIIAMDIYPEMIINSGGIFKNKLLKRFIKWPFNLSYRSAFKVVSLGSMMSQRLIAKGVNKKNIVQISNWATGLPIEDEDKPNPIKDDSLIITYTGNLGTAHEIDTILNTAKRFKNTNLKVRFIFACKGSRKIDLFKIVKKYDINSIVEIRDIIPKSEFNSFIHRSDISIVSIRENYGGLVFPSKAIGLLARGIPIIYIGPNSDINKLIINSNAGACFNIGDDLILFNFLNDIFKNRNKLKTFSKNAKFYYQKYLSYEKARISYLELIEQIIPNS